ncbi:hypothetical protein [Tropicibacter alexandrii]|uniref:hypothetical protein n=1 Tax=Tropicibacter alexandrii TaxID=2267683 RepID=UPI001008A0FA|nr:hypothetical protein [Tropicibacter alexandrii]
MAVPFCKMRPELRDLLAGTRSEIAALNMAVRAYAPVRPRPQSDKTREAAQAVRALDQAYTAATGQAVPTCGELWPYNGPMYQWRWSREAIARRVASAIDRSRRGSVGMHPLTAMIVREFFSAIWPEDLAWPISTPRPNPQTQEQN